MKTKIIFQIHLGDYTFTIKRMDNYVLTLHESGKEGMALWTEFLDKPMVAFEDDYHLYPQEECKKVAVKITYSYDNINNERR